MNAVELFALDAHLCGHERIYRLNPNIEWSAYAVDERFMWIWVVTDFFSMDTWVFPG